MGSNRKLLLIYESMPAVNSSERIDIMLTPQDYTLKREEIPLKYHYQAKKIAPSLFEGLLENAEEYAYFVYQQQESWIFIAYHPEQIRNLLQKKGIDLDHVGKVFFAQQAQSHFSAPLWLDTKKALGVVDDMVVILPRTYMEKDVSPVKFGNHFTPATGVSLKSNQQHSLLSSQQMLGFVAVSILFVFMFISEGRNYQQNLVAEEEKFISLTETSPVLQSKIQRESIFQKYKAIDSKERKKRDFIKQLSKLIFKGVILNEVDMNHKRIEANFVCEDETTVKRLVEALKKVEGLKIKKQTDLHIVIEGVL